MYLFLTIFIGREPVNERQRVGTAARAVRRKPVNERQRVGTAARAVRRKRVGHGGGSWQIIMKLKTRIIITFLIIVLVPMTLTGISFYGFARYQINALREEYGIDVTYENLSNSTMMLSKITQDTFAMMQEEARRDQIGRASCRERVGMKEV